MYVSTMYDRYLSHLPHKIHNHTFRRGGNSEVASIKQIHYPPITSYIHSLVGVVMIKEIWYGRAGATKLEEKRTFGVSTKINI